MADKRNEPVLRFSGATMAFRLEEVFGDRPGFQPESLVGEKIHVETSLGNLAGRVRSVDPYVDDRLGPGHWVVLE